MSRRERHTKIGGQFAPRTIEMLRSPAMGVLSKSGRRVLDRLEIEMADHGGTDNGNLIVTYEDFSAFGIDGHSIGPAIREVVALGFVEITERGRAGNAEFRRPSKYRLTYRHTARAASTNEWERIKTDNEAKEIARAARNEKQKTTGGKSRKPLGETYSETDKSPLGETPSTAIPEKSPGLSIYRVGSLRRRPP